ncbi:ATP-binding protein [Candidatus Manganitrophus noduliformans]|uniref:AAA family ATPase n=1 Tax=Candidatus Manganitrophus noduliformans TaxID=2606439 RepID=A0A7X6IBI6_9BACT|nr:ATP-binding protein [Candidatus Manganitrophus noduliformans]NKE71678.1 AAA family ATPase [Candidatus Manganitrophus noduliformans]
MSNPLISFLTGLGSRRVVETVLPRRTLEEVVLPPQTRRTLEQALAQVRNHALIFGRWGLGERHTAGRGLVFSFAGPPGTGKTVCAEAIAHALGLKLLIVNYAEAESMWVGQTPKNIVATFQAAAEQNAVLFFDEADAIATRRSAGAPTPHSREMNLTVNVLLRELESFNGIVIFATNLAANFDPAFERRIRTHVLFEMPGVEERARIWELQIHPKKTPLAPDVDFRRLAERYELSGGDIKNAVIKAASGAAAEPGADLGKRIHQRHFESAAEAVRSARGIMQQSLFTEEEGAASDPVSAWLKMQARWQTTILVAIGLSGAALVAALVAVALVILH